MKREKLRKVLITVLLAAVSLISVKAQISFNNGKHLLISSKPNEWQSAGSDLNTIVGQQWGIENYENGLNFWRLWPNSNWGNYKIFIGEDGKVGLGGVKNTTNHKVNVNGSQIMVWNIIISSDKTLKRNITNLNDSRYGYLEKFDKLSGKLYDKQIAYPDGNVGIVAEMVAQGKVKRENATEVLAELNERNKAAYIHEFGFLAQELRELYPELVQEEADGLLSVNYIGIIPLLVEAIKDVKRKIIELENSIELENNSLEVIK
ncbi:MAG: tail fiber domain-containing protein [Tannerella sp.]|jgi:polyhydroxyalkanoate synthesis regulator phasin|nr:tail fiber domain-containing protein [Tannerella sp.]